MNYSIYLYFLKKNKSPFLLAVFVTPVKIQFDSCIDCNLQMIVRTVSFTIIPIKIDKKAGDLELDLIWGGT